MDKICAVVDAQGFQFTDRFIAREVAIVSEYMSQCQELNPELYWKNLNEDDQARVMFTTKRINGLHFCPFNPREHCFLPKSSDIGLVLSIWHDMVATEEKNIFAYKNQNVGDILNEIGIPCLDLDDPILKFANISTMREKYGNSYLCAYHKKPPPHNNIELTCAYKKASNLYREIKSMIAPNPMT